MKKALIFVFLAISVSVNAQIYDSVPDITPVCLNGKYVDSLEIVFEEDSINISGILKANCFSSYWLLIRYVSQDSIVLIAMDQCMAGCECPYDFNTTIPDHNFDQYKLIIGYKCENSSYIEYYLDTVINKPSGVINIEKEISEQIRVYPNPALEDINIVSLNPLNKIENINIFDFTLNQFKTIKRNINSSKTKIDLENLKSGIYIIEIETERSKYYKKIIKHSNM